MRHSFSITAGLLLLLIGTGSTLADGTEVAYHALKPSIVSNLVGGPQYIRCDIQLMAEQKSDVAQLRLHNAAVRHAVLMLLAGADGNELTTPEGKEALRMAALGAVQEQLETLTGKPIVKDLYFTTYYVK